MEVSEIDSKLFIDPGDFKKISGEEQMAIIKKLYSRRMRTTYQEVYCKERKDIATSKNVLEDPLLLKASQLYSEKTAKVLAPPLTASRVYGYCRPANYYTGLSEYQGVYSFEGYRHLRELGLSRMSPRVKNCPNI
uniref:Uncharacterized protein n=1 Tax=Clastoptera arizonana TaxID=38151 RepID=A0A1B6E194_9HEMI